MRCELDQLPDPVCPDGCSVRSCRGLEEVEARARAQYGAFASTAPFDRYVERFARFMRSPAYAPERDVVAAAPDGRIAAFCITWTDPRNRIGLFEPVGTHPDFQRKGLGKAVMCEALQRLKAAGMQHAVLCTGEDNPAAVRLYESVGFRVVDRIGFFKKQI